MESILHFWGTREKTYLKPYVPSSIYNDMDTRGKFIDGVNKVFSHFMDQGKGALDVLKSIYPHPTITEGIEECLRMLLNKSVFKPYAFPDYLRIHRYHPDTGLVREK